MGRKVMAAASVGWLNPYSVWELRVHQAARAEQDRVLGQPSQVPFALCLPGCYSLSVQRGRFSAWASVTHCHIHRLDNGHLYISSWLTFPSLHNLVDHYSGNASPGPCCPVCEPCPMEGPRAGPAPTALSVLRKPSLPWNKTESSLLFLETTSPPDGSPISSYLILSETDTPEPDPTGKVVVIDE
ncbi:src-like-adapter 2 [Zonotrichia leucophrys gambelii]|uniref:src-like-adapter 2 n=1 Tax=Zonotrichia leucophrys gambelii TaxID=257770 RepID=UPI0031406891